MSNDTHNWQPEDQPEFTKQSLLQIALTKMSNLFQAMRSSDQAKAVEDELSETSESELLQSELQKSEISNSDVSHSNDSQNETSHNLYHQCFTDHVDPSLYYILFHSWY